MLKSGACNLIEHDYMYVENQVNLLCHDGCVDIVFTSVLIVSFEMYS